MATSNLKPKKRNRKLEKSTGIEETYTPVQNLNKVPTGKMKDINIKATPDQHREFKMYAAARDMSMHDLFFAMWEFYRENHP